jgi:chromosome segregation ATPase
MNIEDSLLKDEQERTLTWAIQNLEKQKEEIDDKISQTSGEVSNIQTQLDRVATLLQDMKEERSAVEHKIEMANQRMATLENEPVTVRTHSRQPNLDLEVSNPQKQEELDLHSSHESAHHEHQSYGEASNAYSTLNIRCRANTLELLRQISLRTGVSENTIMENAVAAVAKAIQKNDFKMHFPLSVKLEQ